MPADKVTAYGKLSEKEAAHHITRAYNDRGMKAAPARKRSRKTKRPARSSY